MKVDVYCALRTKYEGGEEWIGITEARAASWKGNEAQCDYIAINTFGSRGFAIHGHEVKVSRSDWLKELSKPAKADAFMRYCNRWWLVVPAPWKSIVNGEGELPEGWGLMEVSEKGRTRVIIQAPALNREPVPWVHVVGWMSRRDRQEKRQLTQEIAAAETAGREAARKEYERNAGSRLETLQKGLDEARALAAVTGIKLGLNYDLDKRIERLKVLWPLTDPYSGLESVLVALDAVVRDGGHLMQKVEAVRLAFNTAMDALAPKDDPDG